jgi:eukaryotic-like serine/threonine-protein kinase
VSVLASRYELGQSLGSGGMATVVAGHDRVLDRPVAIKLLGRYQQPDARARLLREARAAARLHHPNVVAVYDTGEHDGQPFIVMELVRGGTLADLLQERGRLEVEEAVGIALGVLDALAVAHAAGIVHRDVKPGNVLLPHDGGVKLSDFGIAKALEDATSGLTATGTVLGTPTYLAPELIHGESAGPASDVYSVGCVLFELLTGRPPFTGESSVSVAYAHVHQPVPDVTDLRPEVPRDLATVIATAMRKQPGDRYAAAAEMRTALLEGPAAAPARTAVLPPPPAAAPTQPVATSAPAAAPAQRRGTSWPLVALVALIAIVGLWLLADAAGLLGGAEPDVAVDDPGAGDGAEDAADGDTAEDPAVDDPAEEEPVEEEPTDEPTDEPADEEPVDEEPVDEEPEAPAEPQTLDELIMFLAGSPMGTYGEKHEDLLADLIELRDEQAPGQRAQEAAAIQEEVEDYVANGELDPEVGRIAIAILAEEAAHTGN